MFQASGGLKVETELVGREQDLAELKALIGHHDVRLISITGPGGIGKTRLAQRLADLLREEFTLSAWVELAPVRQAFLVTSAIAAALGIPDPQRPSAQSRLEDLLCSRTCLLVLDNFEHLPDATLQLRELLTAAPRLKIVVTSRLRLRVTDEREFVVGPLAPSAALAMFVRRVQALCPGFEATPDRLPALMSICKRLDGLPLALQLAAARMKLLPPDALAERLSRRLALLVGGPVDAPERHQTLRATLDWSFNLLPPPERRLFLRLSVFSGGADLAAVEVVGAHLATPVQDALEHLMDHSLIQRHGDRYSMLETVREYAAEHLLNSAEAQDIRRRHVMHFLAFAETANAHLNGPGERSWLQRLDAEQHNFRAAMQYCCEHAWSGLALRLGRALGILWAVRGQAAEGLQHLETALRVEPPEDPLLHADVLYRIGSLAMMLSDHAKAGTALAAAMALYTRLDHAVGLSLTLRDVSNLASVGGDMTGAGVLSERSLNEARRSGDQVALLRALEWIGIVKWREGDLALSSTWLQQSEAIARRIGATRLLAHLLISRSALALGLGDEALAAQCLDESIVLCRELELRTLVPMAMHNRAHIAMQHQEWDRAGPVLQQCVSEATQVGGLDSMALHLDGLATVFAHTGHDALAVRTIGAVDLLRERARDKVLPINVAEREITMARLKGRMPLQTYGLLYSQGRMQPLLDLLEEIARVRFDTPSLRPDLNVDDSRLTQRELEVLKLVALSFSDRRIGEILGVSRGTASKHVSSLLGKSGQPNRTSLMRWAVDHGLVAVDSGAYTSDIRPDR